MAQNSYIIKYGDETVRNISPIIQVLGIEGDARPTIESSTNVILEVIEPRGRREISIPYEILSSKELFKQYLSKFLIFIKLDYDIILQRYLLGLTNYKQYNGGISLYYKELGWQKFEGQLEEEFILGDYMLNNIKYFYNGSSMNFKEGTSLEQIQFIQTEILPYKETSLAMTLGLASVIAGYIEDDFGIRFFHYQRQW